MPPIDAAGTVVPIVRYWRMDENEARIIVERAAEREPGIRHSERPSPLRAIREFRGLSLNELASRVGMDPAKLDLMEHQSDLARPTAENRKVIAAVLDAPETVLFTIHPR